MACIQNYVHIILLCCYAEFNSNGHWPYVPIHPKLVPSKLQQHQPTDDKICANGKYVCN